MEQGQTEVIVAEEFIGELTGGYSREIIRQMAETEIKKKRKMEEKELDLSNCVINCNQLKLSLKCYKYITLVQKYINKYA